MTDPTGGGPAPEQTMDDVVRALRTVARERAMRGPEQRGAGRHRERPPRRRRSGQVALAALAALLAGLVVALVAGLGNSPPAPAGATGWTEVVRSLDAARVRAWNQGDLRALREVVVPGSPAHRSDRAASRRLRAAGVVPRGLRFEVEVVGVVSTAADQAVLQVVDRRAPYDLVDASGSSVRVIPARGERAWRVVLRAWRPGGASAPVRWRVAEVRALR